MKRHTKYLFLLIGLIMVAILGYFLWLKFTPDVSLFFNPEASKTAFLKRVRSHGIETSFLFVAITAVMCAIPGLPTSVIGVFAGVCYGPLVGSLINISGNTLGNLFALFLLGKFDLMDKSQKANHWVQVISQAKNPKLKLMLAYMIPVVPSFLVNFTANLLHFKLKQMLPLILLGVAPASILYSFGGDALFQGNHKRAIFFIAGVVVLLLFLSFLKKEHGDKPANKINDT